MPQRCRHRDIWKHETGCGVDKQRQVKRMRDTDLQALARARYSVLYIPLEMTVVCGLKHGSPHAGGVSHQKQVPRRQLR